MNKHGSFLIRPNSKSSQSRNRLALSIVYVDETTKAKVVRHYSIKITSKNKFYVIENRLFDTLEEFVAYYSGEIFDKTKGRFLKYLTRNSSPSVPGGKALFLEKGSRILKADFYALK